MWLAGNGVFQYTNICRYVDILFSIESSPIVVISYDMNLGIDLIDTIWSIFISHKVDVWSGGGRGFLS